MGRNKSELVVDGLPLWRRQLEVLKTTVPEQLLISGPADGPHRSASDAEIVPDRVPGCGPLGGMAASLESCRNDWLLALAVDMPAMEAEYLRALLQECERSGKGAIPRHPNGQLEPLAAVYPRAAQCCAVELLRAGERRLAVLVEALVRAGLAQYKPIAPEEERYFTNWNFPGDVPAAVMEPPSSPAP